ncbi:tannase/feruloyl esterase family alpha/beta hydrolase [Streptomyces cinnabarinus]|uniref:Tannase/feruloyl esterase family alpha/beta hydrolase n=1 Tax=Streptomyces cinnabarinus TaxID=67287 RepID=A0ABY7KNS7_9ACTN|nr:tannase/feruloyl esterase family alpha/beta hydrolase [Streptomyces cinnabarinus]WAZ26205.1 tannase/feruloyl esterase family alpha/beta hydrolase [Streptomyces cinnabarinus]
MRMRWSFVRGRTRTALAAGAALVAMLAAVLVPATDASSARGATASRQAVTADGLADLPAVLPVMDCASVPGLDLHGVTDAPVSISSAKVVITGAAPYCEVRGTIAPANTIVLRLPVDGWTQRYVQTGCGGLCGSANISYGQASACPVIKDGTVASATTDMGHQGRNDGSWALDNPQAQIDFAYRGVHVTSEVAKAVIAEFYGKRPAYSYFTGCSDGGREALMEAQRYPDDFDGIAAGAPANNMVVQNTFHHAWNVLTNRDAEGDYILLADQLPLIHQAVLDACDARDGLTDGVLDDPRRCDFDPKTLVCDSGQDPSTCLTAAQAAVVQRLHDGATDMQGRRLELPISHEWGSELEWTLFVPLAQGQTVASENFVTSFTRYLAHTNAPNPEFRLSDLKFTDESFWKTVQSSSYLAAMDPDLGAYARSGGKLLLWHGWNDQHISPQGTLAYYDALRETMGARAADRFAKFYMFPGVAHCGGGAGPNTFDILTPVMAWAESATVPGRIVASNVSNGTVTRTRPVYPYPQVARYDGTGSVDDASNFVPRTPSTRPDADAYNWLGKRLYSQGYQTWCRAVDGKLVCRPARTWLTERQTSGTAGRTVMGMIISGRRSE